MSEVESPRTAREVLARGRTFLERKQVEAARLEAELLVAHALGMDRLHLFLELERPVAKQELDRARALLVRRGKGEPSAYLIGHREFYGRPFAVEPAVLSAFPAFGFEAPRDRLDLARWLLHPDTRRRADRQDAYAAYERAARTDARQPNATRT